MVNDDLVSAGKEKVSEKCLVSVLYHQQLKPRRG